jgi:hypothetical protein
MGHSFLYARQNTGLIWHTAVRPSVHASYDNISHLFLLLLIGHVVCVSDVLDLSLVSKRFCFWPHITHVIVLTFKEIKYLSDYRIIATAPHYSGMSYHSMN